MREGQNPNRALPFEIYDVIREAAHREPAGGYVVRYAWNASANLRPLGNAFQRGIHGLDKLKAKAKSLAAMKRYGHTLRLDRNEKARLPSWIACVRR